MFCTIIKSGDVLRSARDVDPDLEGLTTEWDFEMLVKLWLFSAEYESPLAQNVVMDIMIEKILKSPTNYPAEIDTLISEKVSEEWKLWLLNARIHDDITILRELDNQSKERSWTPEEAIHVSIAVQRDLYWTVGGVEDVEMSRMSEYRWLPCAFHVHPEGIECPDQSERGRKWEEFNAILDAEERATPYRRRSRNSRRA